MKRIATCLSKCVSNRLLLEYMAGILKLRNATCRGCWKPDWWSMNELWIDDECVMDTLTYAGHVVLRRPCCPPSSFAFRPASISDTRSGLLNVPSRTRLGAGIRSQSHISCCAVRKPLLIAPLNIYHGTISSLRVAPASRHSERPDLFTPPLSRGRIFLRAWRRCWQKESGERKRMVVEATPTWHTVHSKSIGMASSIPLLTLPSQYFWR